MMLFLLLSYTIALASFGPNVRIDHEDLPDRGCYDCAIAFGPGAPSSQPIYVVFEDDSMLFAVQSNIMFQKSTDAGRTWLPADVLVRRGENFAMNPDITTDLDGNVYIVYDARDSMGTMQVWCVRSSDGGTVWSAPAKVGDESDGPGGLGSIVADSDGNLFVALGQLVGGLGRIFTSVSTDKGVTWSPRVCVDNDTLTFENGAPEVFVQPGTNHYLVAATTYRWAIGHYVPYAYLYRSTDRGQTFQPGVQLDTFNWAAFLPHVVADRDHIIYDYFGEGRDGGPTIAEARTFYTQADSWSSPARVVNLDSLHELYYSGTLALSGDGRVHTALMVQDTADLRYNVYYTSSSDHGVSWADIELVTDDTTVNSWYPDIGTDSAGHAYIVWYQPNVSQGEIWFATNNPAAIAEQPMQQPIGAQPSATVVRNVLFLAERPSSSASTSSLLDISGRDVLVLKPGANDVRSLSPGVYFIREGLGNSGEGPGKTQKVVVAR
jgi:hypothetical protein